MARVLYVIWWEGTRTGGIIENQVYRQLEHTVRHGGHTISLLSGGPFWKGMAMARLRARFPAAGPLARRGDGWLREPAKLKARLAQSGIDLVFRNTIGRPKTLYLKWWALATAPLLHLHYFHRLCRRKDVDLVHCRSYFPTWLALLSRSLFGGRYKVIFDTRGLLPEEAVSTGQFAETSLSYRFWKKVEHWMLWKTDCVVNISETFTEDLQAHGGPPGMETVYASVDLSSFSGSDDCQATVPEPVRKALENRPVLVYLGKISDRGWHSVPYLARMFKLFQSRFPGARLLIVTTSGHDVVRAGLEAESVRPGDVVIQAARSTAEVSGYLGLATYAALPFRDIRGEFDRRIAHTMIASKMAEYLAAGLPVLCHEAIGGASEIIRKHQVGHVVDLEHPDTGAVMHIPDPRTDGLLARRCRETSVIFGMDRIGQQFSSLYTRMSST